MKACRRKKSALAHAAIADSTGHFCVGVYKRCMERENDQRHWHLDCECVFESALHLSARVRIPAEIVRLVLRIFDCPKKRSIVFEHSLIALLEKARTLPTARDSDFVGVEPTPEELKKVNQERPEASFAGVARAVRTGPGAGVTGADTAKTTYTTRIITRDTTRRHVPSGGLFKKNTQTHTRGHM